jgi:hypothetical protein
VERVTGVDQWGHTVPAAQELLTVGNLCGVGVCTIFAHTSRLSLPKRRKKISMHSSMSMDPP